MSKSDLNLEEQTAELMEKGEPAIAGLSFAEPEWAKEIPEGDFISHFPSYRAGECLDLYEEFSFSSEGVDDIRYYVFDPIKNGADPEGTYPVLFFFHGMGNSLDGKVAINYSMAEFFASKKHQDTIGGAYIVVPMANETRNEQGMVENGWGPDYYKPIMNLKRTFYKEHSANVGKNFFFGTSAGGFFVWGLLSEYSKEMDIAIPIAGGNIPELSKLEEIRENGTLILTMHGKHDELVPFDEAVTPHIEDIQKMRNIICYYPEWVRNGDGGIAQMNPWVEMGQHCLNNQVTSNLMYDDGTPYDAELFPEGISGWIRDHKK